MWGRGEGSARVKFWLQEIISMSSPHIQAGEKFIPRVQDNHKA